MSSARKFSEAEKGKGIPVIPDPSKIRRVPTGIVIDPERLHREALNDVAGLDSSQRALVVESETLRGDGDGKAHTSDEADSGSPEKEPPRSAASEDEAVSPMRFYEIGTFETLPALRSEMLRPSRIDGQDWGNVLPTWSTRGSVKRLLRECEAYGVTFLIPKHDQRPWTPPVGYQCVYQSFFERDAKLWFPIPRLITSYCARRNIAMTQLMTGAIRVAVALMVMAAEVDVSMGVRVFEELTQTRAEPNGLFSVKMRSNLHILTGHPSKTSNWQRYYFYVKCDEAAFEDPPSNDYRVLWNPRLGRVNRVFLSL